MSSESAKPEPVDALNCFGQPLGLEVARTLETPDWETAHVRETRLAIKALKQRIRAVLDNTSEEYKSAVISVNERFLEDDAWAAYEQIKIPRLVRQPVMEWLVAARYSEVAKFCLWNVQHHKGAQESLQRDKPQLDAETIIQAERLVELGLFPAHAPSAIEHALQQYGPLHAMDSFESGAMGANGYCTTKTIALAKHYFNYYDLTGLEPQMFSTHFHEGIHGASMTQKMGFVHAVDEELLPEPSSFLEEVSASHHQAVARNADRPDPSILSPGQRFDSTTGSYPAERLLATYMLELGEQVTPVNVLSSAHFEKLGHTGSARRELAQALISNMAALFPGEGKDAFARFNYEYNHARPRQRPVVVGRWTADIERQFDDQSIIEDSDPQGWNGTTVIVAADRAEDL